MNNHSEQGVACVFALAPGLPRDHPGRVLAFLPSTADAAGPGEYDVWCECTDGRHPEGHRVRVPSGQLDFVDVAGESS